MPENALEELVMRLAEPLVESLGLVIWGVECPREGRLTLRLFVDGPGDAETSPSIDACETISRRLGLALEVEDAIGDAYVLEVSTPGLNRRFFRPDQLAPYVGDVVDVVLERAGGEGCGNRRRWRGVLAALEGEDIVLRPAKVTEAGDVLEEGREPVRLPWGNVRKASRHHVFRRPQKPGKGRRTDAPEGRPTKADAHAAGA
ncbi:MAG: ribosome maturation factor RimP [Desulfovibrio sp.]|jgi:ribosome maturation factor RimP|nr:ribosome maturation factor RimP [Desulfovibrio sp.]